MASRNLEAGPPRRVHLGKLLKGHENRWVALDREMKRVVASGVTLAKAVAQAEKRGHADAIVIWSPPTMEGYEL